MLLPAHDDDSLPPTPTPIRVSERDAIAMEAASRAMEEATRKMEAASRAASLEDAPPRKRLYLSEEERLMAHAGMPSCHLKITSRSKHLETAKHDEILSGKFQDVCLFVRLFVCSTASPGTVRP